MTCHQDAFIAAAIAYAEMWIAFQMRQASQPGCAIAIRHGDSFVMERAFGVADQLSEEPLTPRHRFRIASLSKTFTAVGVLLLQEAGRLDIREPVGKYVDGLHPQVALAPIGQLLSHSSGISRDSSNAGYFADVIPFPSRSRVERELAKPPVIEAGARLKYSNYAYALLGLLIETLTGEDYQNWIARNVIKPAGLTETTPDMPSFEVPFARGHSSLLPLGRRVIIPGDNETKAFACVTGFTSTAADIARFYAQLSPHAPESILSAATRKAMAQARLPDTDSAFGHSYGLGVQVGKVDGLAFFGHLGRFQGTTSRAIAVPAHNLAFAVLTNAIDGPAIQWVDNLVRIFERFKHAGPPAGFAASWTQRLWNMYGAMDFVALGESVCAFNPAMPQPFFEMSEISLCERDRGVVTKAPAVERLGEVVQRVRSDDGSIAAIKVGGAAFVDEKTVASRLLQLAG